MLKEKKFGELGLLAECENCSEELGTNVLATTASNLHCFEAQIINFSNYKSFDEIIEILERMEQQGLHLVGSNGKTVFKSSKMAQVVEDFKQMKEEDVSMIVVYACLPLLTRTCNLRLQVFRIFVDDFDIGKDDDIVDNNKMSKSQFGNIEKQKRTSAVLDLPI